jgi:hypothetical protein
MKKMRKRHGQGETDTIINTAHGITDGEITSGEVEDIMETQMLTEDIQLHTLGLIMVQLWLIHLILEKETQMAQ